MYLPFSIAALCVFSLLGACQTSRVHATGPIDSAKRSSLLDSVKGLQGTWEMTDGTGEKSTTQFHPSSRGSAVREIMFPGTEVEMTNVYHLDGNALIVTHYCAEGTQPRMRATARIGNKITFVLDSISDLRSPGDGYMGGLTLEIKDANHFVQHWKSFGGDKEPTEVAFQWKRKQ